MILGLLINRGFFYIYFLKMFFKEWEGKGESCDDFFIVLVKKGSMNGWMLR